jgi:predicted  nucleic acid-binding Zn-ribbon protein
MFKAFITKILKNVLSSEFQSLENRVSELDKEVADLRSKHSDLAQRHLTLHDKYRRTKNVVRNIERGMTRKQKLAKAA